VDTSTKNKTVLLYDLLWVPLHIYYHFYVIIILGISFMHGIYTYIPETNRVPREHCVATILM